ncbi:MAG: elongation factor P [Candidatus Zixiibacteriota bacterium]
MISAGDLRKGKKLMIEGSPYFVVDFMHVKMGRGRPHVKAKMKNILTGQVIEKSFLTTESFDEPDLRTEKMQFLYAQGNEYVFMHSETFEQVTILEEVLGDTRWYLIENDEYAVAVYEGNPIGLELPASVVMTVTESDPGIKGDTVSNVMKPAKIETGLSLKVPMFVKEGDKIKIDTRTGEYIERAN